jgi:glutathione S-transferase
MQVGLREVVLRDKPQEMIAISPKATVPVLHLPDGEVIDESLDIMRWALGKNDPEGWLDHVDNALIAANDVPFKEALDRYKYPTRFGLENGEAERDSAMAHLLALDKRLQITAFLGGEQLAFTDAAIFPFIRQFAATDRCWFDEQDWPALRHWPDQLAASEMFAAIMMRHRPWLPGDMPVRFP